MKNQLLTITIITVITIISFINIFGNSFAIDDKTFIGGWESAKHLSNIPKFFQGAVPEGHQGVYRPIRNSLMAVYYKVFGTNAFWYHLHSLAVHLASTILVFYIVRLLLSSRPSSAFGRTSGGISRISLGLQEIPRLSRQVGIARNDIVPFAAALLFATHPIHTETIDYISASLDATGLVFLFLSFYLYLIGDYFKASRKRHSGERSDSRISIRDAGQASMTGVSLARLGSLICALLALFTYEVTLVLPLLIVLYEVCMGSLSSRGAPQVVIARNKVTKQSQKRLPRFLRSLAMTTPYFILAAIFFVIRFFLLHITARGPYLGGSIYFTFLTMTKVFFNYIMLMLWPFNLSLNHIVSKGIEAFVYRDYRTEAILAQSLFDKEILLGLLGVLGLLGLAIKLYRKHPLVTFGIGWFFISLLPVSEIVPQGSMMNEKFLYLPSFGFVLIVAYLWWVSLRGAQRRSNPIGLRLLRFARNDNTTIKFLLSIFLSLLLALFYGILTFQRNRDWHDDITIWSKDVAIAPKENSYAHFSLGNAYEENNQLPLALKEYQKSFDINPHFVVALASKGVVYANMGKPDLAIEVYKKAVTISPYFWEGHNNLGNIYQKQGKTDLAEGELRQTVAINPNFLPAQINLESLLSDKIGTASAKGKQANWTKYEGEFSFEYPKTWTIETPHPGPLPKGEGGGEGEQLTIISDTKTFKIEFLEDLRREDLSAQDYVERDTSNFGKLVNQGLAKIPNMDFGFVKIWDPSNGKGAKPKLQFFLFKGKKVVQVIVFPGDSPFMKQFDAILASISL